jgi:hypothetical protein
MTIQTMGGGFFWPEPITNRNLSSTPIINMVLDSGTKKAAAVFQAPATGTVEKVIGLISAYTSTGNLDFRLETIDASTGAPTGSLVTGTTANALVSITGTGKFSATLDVEVVRGTSYGFVLARSAGSYSVGAFTYSTDQYRRGMGTTYVRYDAGSGYETAFTTATSQGRCPIFGIKIEGSWYPIFGSVAISAIAQTTFNNGSATRERGCAIVLPFPARVTGFFAVGIFGATNADFILANTSGTALATYAFDKESMTAYNGHSSSYPYMVQGIFSADVDLTAGTTYYLTAKPQSGSNTTLTEVDIIDTADSATMGCLNGGTRMKQVTRDSGGTYTVVDTKRPFSMGLIVSGFGDDAGGGSTVYVGGVTF